MLLGLLLALLLIPSVPGKRGEQDERRGRGHNERGRGEAEWRREQHQEESRRQEQERRQEEYEEYEYEYQQQEQQGEMNRRLQVSFFFLKKNSLILTGQCPVGNLSHRNEPSDQHPHIFAHCVGLSTANRAVNGVQCQSSKLLTLEVLRPSTSQRLSLDLEKNSITQGDAVLWVGFTFVTC